MKAWVVRFCSLYAFNVVVLLVIGLLTPARVGAAVVWAAVIMTLAEVFVKPLAHRAFARSAAKTASERTHAGEALVQGLIVFAVAGVIWLITLVLSRVNTGSSWFWAYVLPPIVIAIGWFVYALVDDRLEQATGELFDRAEAGIRGSSPSGADASDTSAASDAGAAAARAAAAAEGAAELRDGLTPEQRRMLDDLGA
ncbi:MAG: hypothetical protein QM677_07145 [Microbacterium sp.]